MEHCGRGAQPVRVIVCGSRDWTDYRMILEKLRELPRRPPVTIVHGAARGADMLADAAAGTLGLQVEPHPADWTGRGRRAGVERNALMASLGADLVLAFKDGFDFSLRTGGTENMVRLAAALNIPYRIYSHEDQP